MNNLEKRLEEAYNDLEVVDRLYDNLTQDNRKQIDYCISKRDIVCDRIRAIKREIELDKQYVEEKPKETMEVFILKCVKEAQMIDKIRYKKDTAVAKQIGIL